MHVYITTIFPYNPQMSALVLFSHFYLLFMCTKGELGGGGRGGGGGSFCIEILSMISQKRIGEKKKGTSHSFPLSWRYIKCCTRETVYEKVFFCFRHLIL